MTSAFFFLITLSPAGGGFFQHFSDAAVASFRTAIVKDAEQSVSAARGRHALPTFPGARIAREGGSQDRGQLLFGIHGRHQLLSNLFGGLGLNWTRR